MFSQGQSSQIFNDIEMKLSDIRQKLNFSIDFYYFQWTNTYNYLSTGSFLVGQTKAIFIKIKIDW